MKNLMIVSLVAVLVLALVGCGSTTPASTDPATIVKNYYDAIAAKDLDKVMSFLADDALLTNPQGKFQGKEAIRPYMQGLIDDGFHSENSNYRESNGEVRYDYKVYFGDELVDQNTDGLTIVQDGKIVFDGLEKDKPK